MTVLPRPRRSRTIGRLKSLCTPLATLLFALIPSGTTCLGATQLVFGSSEDSSPDRVSVSSAGEVDLVTVRRIDRDSELATSLDRRGEIIEIRAGEVTLLANEREKRYEIADVLEIKTAWSEAYRSGLAALEAGQLKKASELLRVAIAQEQRPWAQRIIRSKLIVALECQGQVGGAAEQFLQIINQDPQSHFLYLMPLPWAGAGNALAQPARQWVESDSPVISLLGASWLLTGPDRDRAVRALESLSRDIDPRIKGLALAQLWRIRVQVKAKQLEVWQRNVDDMPRELRAGPSLMLGQMQARAGHVNEAIVSLLRVPILYPEQKSLGSAALYQAADLLHNGGQVDEAAALINELLEKYPESFWAQQAKQ